MIFKDFDEVLNYYNDNVLYWINPVVIDPISTLEISIVYKNENMYTTSFKTLDIEKEINDLPLHIKKHEGLVRTQAIQKVYHPFTKKEITLKRVTEFKVKYSVKKDKVIKKLIQVVNTDDNGLPISLEDYPLIKQFNDGDDYLLIAWECQGYTYKNDKEPSLIVIILDDEGMPISGEINYTKYDEKFLIGKDQYFKIKDWGGSVLSGNNSLIYHNLNGPAKIIYNLSNNKPYDPEWSVENNYFIDGKELSKNEFFTNEQVLELKFKMLNF
jgi:hypothetical protein